MGARYELDALPEHLEPTHADYDVQTLDDDARNMVRSKHARALVRVCLGGVFRALIYSSHAQQHELQCDGATQCASVGQP